jgi:uncharacterized membrane protein
VTFAHPLPWWGFLLAVSGVGLVSWFAYRRATPGAGRRGVLAVLRSVTLLLLILFLMRPIRTAQEGTRDALVPVLVDASRSMSIADANGARRIDRAREVLTRELMPLLGPKFRVEVLAFGEDVRDTAPAALAPTDRRSDVSRALAAVAERYRGRPVAGIVLLSDGGDTADTAAPGDEAAPPPVFTMGFGSTTVAGDREVLSVTAADAVLDDSRIDLAVTAVSHGHGTEPFAIRLVENGRPLQVRRVTPSADGVPVHQVFQVSPARGSATVYTVDVPVAAGELVPENNTRSAIVQTPSRARRVLFVEGAPGFEHSFLKRAWAADTGLEIDSIVRKGKNDQGTDTFYIQASRSRSDALTSGYPQRLEDLFAYDALVLANVESGQFTTAELDATRAFVAKRGGGLLVLGARSFGTPGLIDTPVEDVLPLQLSSRADDVLPASSSRGVNLVSLTAAGEAHPVMQLGSSRDDTRKKWAAAPALASVSPLGGARPGATVLAVTAGAGGATRALVAVQRYGEGRTMVFTGEAAWRWRMLLPSSDRSYDTFWRQAVRWLALPAGDPITLTVPAGATPGDSVAVQGIVRTASFEPQPDATVDLFITAPDGHVERLRAAPARGGARKPGEYAVRFRPEQTGVYRVSAEARRGSALLGSAATVLLAGGSDPEMSDPRLNVQFLQRLARESGGRVIAPSDVASLPDLLTAGIPAARLSATRDLWHTGWSFGAIVLLLGTEWVLRRKWGLR